jgi:hypothetical protein
MQFQQRGMGFVVQRQQHPQQLLLKINGELRLVMVSMLQLQCY